MTIQTKMQILAISGSLRASSTNTTLLRAMARLAPPSIQVSLYEGLGDLPHFSPDLEDPTPPAPVEHLRKLLQEAQGVLICTPEYAFGMPGSLKNLLDWTVSSGEFVDKPVAALSASPGATGGQKALASLLLTLGVLSARVVEGATLSVPLVRTKLDAQGEVSDPALVQSLQAVLEALAETVEK